MPDYFEIGPNGTFEPFTWTFSETSEVSNSDAELKVTVEAGH